MDELWERFYSTGKISDYINYIRFLQGENNADDVKGAGASGTKSR